MFFVLSKILDVAFSPLWWALALIAAGAVLIWRRPAARRASLGFIAGGCAVLMVFSWQPLSNALYRAAEQPLESTIRPGVVYDAAIVLGGALSLGPTQSTGEPQFNEGVERVLAAFDLWRTGRVRNIFISGGDPDPQGAPVEEAAIEAKVLASWGVPAEHLLVETRSRNTRENAAESAPIIQAHGWKSLLLITSAAHMRRASETFRRVGLSFDTLAVDVRTYDPGRRHGSWLPRTEFLQESSSALRELSGRWIYRLRGYAAPH